MNKQQLDILYSIWEYGGINQRVIAKNSGYSLGNVNQTIRLLSEEGFISEGSAYAYAKINKEWRDHLRFTYIS